MSLVVIDDEPSVLNALTLLLKAIGYQARGFHIASEALDYLRSEEGKQVTCILCDLRMPEMSGFEVLQNLRTFDAEKVFVLISAHADEDDVAHALELGANGFLGKPFTPDQFHELYADLVGSQQVENS